MLETCVELEPTAGVFVLAGSIVVGEDVALVNLRTTEEIPVDDVLAVVDQCQRCGSFCSM